MIKFSATLLATLIAASNFSAALKGFGLPTGLANMLADADTSASKGSLTNPSHLTRAFTHRHGIIPVRYQQQVARR